MYLKLLFCFLLIGCGGLEAKVDDRLARFENMKSEEFFEKEMQRKLADAVSYGEVEKIEKLVSQGADTNYLGRKGMTPLMWGVAKQSYSGVELLLNLGADPNLKTEAGSAVELASFLEDSKYLRALLEHGGNADVPIGKSGRTALFESVLHERIDNIRLLAAYGANVNHQANSGESVLSYAISTDSYRAALVLLELGADPKMKDRWGYSAYDVFFKYAGKGVEEGNLTHGFYEELRRELEKRYPE